MKRFGFLAQRTWTAGIVLAVAGAVTARFIAPRIEASHRAYVLLPAQVIALLGLFLIAWGVSRRLRQSTE